jgi:CubicO group peptidase (beta-lactamase class C family)
MRSSSLNFVSNRTLLSACLAWITISSAGIAQQNAAPETFISNLRDSFTQGEEITRYELSDRMAHYNIPGLALAIIEDGEIVYSAGYGVLQIGSETPVDANTVFSAGSVSKIATATMILNMVENETLDLDQPVSNFLTSWTLPDSNRGLTTPVTLRMILSHTSGFNMHGFGDFQPGAELPSVYDTLNGTAPASDGPLELMFEPTTQYRYSGGGYTLAQLIVSDVSEDTFQATLANNLFAPLGMTRSSFSNPLPEDHGNIAKAHNLEGEAVALPRGYESMPEMAASGLWTSSTDLGTLVASLINSYRHDTGFLSQETASEMMTLTAPSEHGLGPRMQGSGMGLYFHHGGANNSYQTWIEGHLATGDGLVILTNGSNGNALNMEIRNAVADVMGWDINQPIMIPNVSVSTSALNAFTGTFTVDENFPMDQRQNMVGNLFELDLEITRAEDASGLSIVLGRNGSFPMIATSPNRFMIPAIDPRIGLYEIEFHRNAHGNTASMTLHTANASSHYVIADEETE